MPAHTVPINLPKDNETKEQFITRSGKILMRTGKSKEQAQQIAEDIWDRHILRDVRFTPGNIGQDVRWTANRGSQLNLGTAPPPLKMSQQGKLNGFDQASELKRTSQGYDKTPNSGGVKPPDIGINKLTETISRGVNDLIKGQQQLIRQATQTNEYLDELVTETRSIRSQGHKIRVVRQPNTPPRSHDLWAMDKGFNMAALRNPQIMNILPPELIKPLRALDFILNPVKTTHQFVERKVKGISGKISDMLNGPMLTEFQRDPKALAKIAGIKVLDKGDLKDKIITKIIPEKFEEITDLQREQLDVLRNLYNVTKDNHETTTGKKYEYEKTSGAKDRVFDAATGTYMDKKRFEAELKKRTKMIDGVLKKVKSQSLGGLLSTALTFGAQKLTGNDNLNIDINEELEKFNEKAFGTRRNHSDSNLTKLATKSTYNEEGVEDDLAHHASRQHRINMDLQSIRGGRLSDINMQIWNFLNGGTLDRNGNQRSGPYNINNMMGAGKPKGTEVESWNPTQSIGPPPPPGSNINPDGSPFIQSVRLVGVDKDLLKTLKDEGGFPVRVFPDPLPVSSDDWTTNPGPNPPTGGPPPSVHHGGIESVGGTGEDRKRKPRFHHSGIENVEGPPHHDNVKAILQKGEKVISKGKAVKMDISSAATAEGISELIGIEKRKPPLSEEFAKGLKIAAEHGISIGGEPANLSASGNRTVGMELKEAEAARSKNNEEAYKKGQLTKQDKMVKLLEEIRDKKMGGDGNKKEEEGGWLSKLFGWLGSLLPLLAPFLAALAAGGALALGLKTLADTIGVKFGTLFKALEGLMGIVNNVASKLGLGKKVASLAESAGKAIKTGEAISEGVGKASKLAEGASKVGEAAEGAGKIAEGVESVSKTAEGIEAGAKASKVGQVAEKGGFFTKTANSISKGASAAYNWVAETKAGQFVGKIVKTVKGAFNHVTEALGVFFKASSGIFESLFTAYKSLKGIKYIGPLIKGLELVVKGLVKVVNVLLNNKIVLGAMQVIGVAEVLYKIGALYYNWDDDSAVVATLKVIHIVIKALNCKVLRGMYLAVGATGAGAAVSIPWMLFLMGMDYLLDYVIDYLSKPDASKESLGENKTELPNEVTEKMNQTEPDKVGADEAQNELPTNFSELDPGTDQSKKASKSGDPAPPMMHSGGVVRHLPSDLSKLSGTDSKASGFVDSQPGEDDNVQRTLQRGEYVMTKGETRSLTQIMQEIKNLLDIIQKDVAESTVDLNTLKKYADEAEKRRESEDENRKAGLDKDGNPLGAAGSSGSSGSGGSSSSESGGFFGSIANFLGFGNKPSEQGTKGAPVGSNSGGSPGSSKREGSSKIEGPQTFGEQGGRGSGGPVSKDRMSQVQAIRDRGDLGALTELGETGSLKGKIDMVSDGMKGRDKGGVSYGLYQFSSKTGGLDTLIKAGLNSKDEQHQRFAKRLQAVKGDATSNTGQFAETWKSLAKENPEEFKKFQEQGFSSEWYNPVMKGLKDRGIDVDNRSKAFKSMVWSMAAQHGPNGALGVLDKAWGKDAGKLTDADMIGKAYDERYKMDSPDKMKYFKEGTPIKGLKLRHEREKALALGLLEGENANQTAANFASAPNQKTGTIDPSKYGIEGLPKDMTPEQFAAAKQEAGANSSKFYSPIQGRQITSGFGERNVKGGSKNHKAIDIKYKEGESVAAMSGGQVSKVGSNYIEVKQEDGHTARYMHMNPASVKMGQKIEAGQSVGTIKTEGTGSHLDFQIKDQSGTPINPEKYLESKYQAQGQEYKPSYQSAASNKYKPGSSGTGSPVSGEPVKAVASSSGPSKDVKSKELSQQVATNDSPKVSNPGQVTKDSTFKEILTPNRPTNTTVRQSKVNMSAVDADERMSAAMSNKFSKTDLAQKEDPSSKNGRTTNATWTDEKTGQTIAYNKTTANTWGFNKGGYDGASLASASGNVNSPDSQFQKNLASAMPMDSSEKTMEMMNASAAQNGGRQAPPAALGKLDVADLESGYQSTNVSNVQKSESVTKERAAENQSQDPIVLPPEQVPMTVNPNSNKASMAQMQDRKIDLTSSAMIEKIFANTIVSFMTLATDFALGNKSSNVFKNSFSA